MTHSCKCIVVASRAPEQAPSKVAFLLVGVVGEFCLAVKTSMAREEPREQGNACASPKVQISETMARVLSLKRRPVPPGQ